MTAKTILVVDDSKLARMAMTRVLGALRPEWIRIEAPNAEEAMAHVASAGPDVAVIDYNMPGSDGLSLARQISEQRPGMPIAIISANFQQEVMDRAAAVGATFLAKPITEPALRTFIEAAEKRMAGD